MRVVRAALDSRWVMRGGGGGSLSQPLRGNWLQM